MINKKRDNANILHNRYLRILAVGRCFFFLTLFLFAESTSNAQTDSSFEEIIVSVNVQEMGFVDMPAIIKNDRAYLPVTDLFSFLKIKTAYPAAFDSVYGFFIHPDSTYNIDRVHNRISYAKRVYPIDENDIIKTETGMFMRADYFGKYFGLDCKFNFRALLVNVTTKLELPVVREAKLAMLRNNINRLNGTTKADTVVKRDHQFFHFGMLDWSIISNQLPATTGELSMPSTVDTRMTLGLGGVIAGGETNVLINYDKGQPLDEKLQYYQWKMVNNDNPIVKQVALGKIAVQTVASIYAPIVGAQLTNASTVLKRAFGYYTLTQVTEPGWVVELFVNNVLIDYKKADAAGSFTFDVPLVYGNSAVKLKFYGPFGEERSREESISIPFNFMPKNQFEYTISGGFVEDDSNSKFSKVAMNYGINNHLTIGGGAEYLSTVRSGSFMPYTSLSARVGQGLLVSGQYNYSVMSKYIMSYRTPSNLQFEVDYSRYDKNQTAVNTQVLEERKAFVSIPIRRRKYSLFSQLTVDQSILSTTRYLSAEWMLSGIYHGVDAHLTTYGIYYQNSEPIIYNNISIGFRGPWGLTLTSQAQYNFSSSYLMSVKQSIDKNLKKSYFGLYYEKNFLSNLRNIGLQFRYNLAFAQVGFNSIYTNNQLSLLESARGTLMFDGKTKYVGTGNTVSAGRGCIVLAPFLDLNCNGKKDPGEPKLSGLKFRINGGTVQEESKDTLIRILNLEPYNKYMLELSRFSFDNIAWQIRKPSMSVAVNANSFKLIEIPVAVVGEVTGYVYIDKNKTKKGQGQVYVCFYRSDTLVSKTLTEPDGFFSFIGLAPGHYTAKIDTEQMVKIDMQASRPLVFNINSSVDGDVVDGLEFTIHPNKMVVDTTENHTDSIKNEKNLKSRLRQRHRNATHHTKNHHRSTSGINRHVHKMVKPRTAHGVQHKDHGNTHGKTKAIAHSHATTIPKARKSISHQLRTNQVHNRKYAIKPTKHTNKKRANTVRITELQKALKPPHHLKTMPKNRVTKKARIIKQPKSLNHNSTTHINVNHAKNSTYSGNTISHKTPLHRKHHQKHRRKHHIKPKGTLLRKHRK